MINDDKATKEYTLRWVFSFVALSISFFHIYAVFSPSFYSWGFHHLAFLPGWMRILIPILMLLATIPVVQSYVLLKVERFTLVFQNLKVEQRTLFIVISIIASTAVFWLGRAETTFLGDGQYLMHTVAEVKSVDDIPLGFPHEPLVGYLVWRLFQLLMVLHISPDPQIAYQVLSIIFGIGFLIVLQFLVRYLFSNEVDRLLGYFSIVCAGTIQFFFGYMENYPPAFLGIFILIMFSILYLRRRIHLVIPSIVLGILSTLYFGTLIFLPAFCYLCYHSIKRRELLSVFVSICTMIFTSAVLLGVCGYTFDLFIEKVFGGASHLIQIAELKTDWQGYTMFSPKHLIDIFNLQMLIAPFALFLIIFGIVERVRLRSPMGSEWTFLIIMTSCGLAMMAVFNCDIGMSRDWDLLGTFSPGLLVASIYGWTQLDKQRSSRRRLLVMMIVITGLHTMPWVIVNASEKRAMARFDCLLKNSFWGKNAFKVNEELAYFYRERKNYKQSVVYYKTFLDVDSTNSRIWLKLADMYEAIKDEANEMRSYEKAVQYGSQSWRAYVNLGTIYAKQQKFAEAIEVTKKGITLNPQSAIPCYYLGEYYIQYSGSYQDALPYFLRAIEIDSSHAESFLKAGLSYLKLNNPSMARPLLETYAMMRPNDFRVKNIRQFLDNY